MSQYFIKASELHVCTGVLRTEIEGIKYFTDIIYCNKNPIEQPRTTSTRPFPSRAGVCFNQRRAQVRSRVPVSYTHLDVYKRQILNSHL